MHGCPKFSATTWIRFLSANPSLLGLILIIFGLVSTFRGKAFFDLTVGVLGFGIMFLVTMLIFSILNLLEYLDGFDDAVEITITVLAFTISIVLSVIVGFLLYKAGWMLGVLLVGTVAGFFLGVSLYNLLFIQLYSWWVYTLLVVGCAALVGYLAKTFHKHIMIYGTSFIGAYALVRGVSFFLGGFPNEALLYG